MGDKEKTWAQKAFDLLPHGSSLEAAKELDLHPQTVAGVKKGKWSNQKITGWLKKKLIKNAQDSLGHYYDEE